MYYGLTRESQLHEMIADVCDLFPGGSWVDTINETKVQYNELLDWHCPISGLFGSGYNGSGQLGFSAPVTTVGFVLSIADDAIDFDVGGGHGVIVKSDGTLWGSGKNSSGQLGQGDTTDIDAWTQIGADSDWASVACGNTLTVAIKNNGTI